MSFSCDARFWCTCTFFFFTFKQYKRVLTITGMHIRSFHDLVHRLYYYFSLRCLFGRVVGDNRTFKSVRMITFRHSYKQWSLNCSNSGWVSQVNNSPSVGILLRHLDFFLRVLPKSRYQKLLWSAWNFPLYFRFQHSLGFRIQV